ncbi:MAG TPA: hypothetical protein V6D23_20475 [Candidatus Obscuribacterales bacterium]
MESHAFQATVHVANAQLQTQLEQARLLLQQARYKQAVRMLDEILEQPVALVDRLQFLARRALAYALWKKPEEAIDEASGILAQVRADTEDLINLEIDWEYEKSQDVGHLAFLADVYQLRGVLWLLRHNPRRAVEDLSLSAFMTADESQNALNYLQRAIALIELQDCFERALEDLRLAWGLDASLVQGWLHLPVAGQFAHEPKGLCFRHETGEIFLTPEKTRPRMNRLGPAWFRLSHRFGV